MSRPLKLVHFSPLVEPAVDAPDGTGCSDDEGRSYERGYADGWEESTAAQSAEIAALRGRLGQSLAEMTLTHAAARRHILGSLEPLLRAMVEKILPNLAHASLGHRIVHELLATASDMTDAPIIVKTAPECLSAVTQILLTETALPVRIEAEDGLDHGHAYICRNGAEVSLDLDRAVQAIGEAVAGYFQLDAQEANP